MSATEELRRLLDERGVEYETDDHMGFSETRWGGACAFQLAPGAGLVMAVTPEQAVEATLGREQPPYDKLVETLRRDWDIECSWDGLRRFWYVGLTDEGVRKRDEREAALGSGTCEYEFVPNIGGGHLNACGLRCSSCGREQMSLEPPNYCPDCGRKVADDCR